MCCEPRCMMSLACCKRRKELQKGGEEAGAGEPREKNGTLGTSKESREPAPGWKEMPSVIAPYYGSKEEMETAFCVGNKGIYPSPKTKGGQFTGWS